LAFHENGMQAEILEGDVPYRDRRPVC
jgi:hypothetical protein